MAHPPFGQVGRNVVREPFCFLARYGRGETRRGGMGAPKETAD